MVRPGAVSTPIHRAPDKNLHFDTIIGESGHGIAKSAPLRGELINKAG
jgi:hypothetical protein